MSETRICANCGAEHPVEDMYQVEGDWLCEDCADRLTVICDHCAERFYEENIVEDDTHTLCDRCGERVYRRETRQVNHHTLCPQCCGKVRAQN